ncbi:key lime pathogenicity protein [Fusarium austroafricanum]|uniref:Key lime pathogenicity protein n=1 Tax=Fusarium austroafricanum TaxID=2364996 RepID=A0A8H4JGN5_9HYPO|nr:key lime pathogenicity protein [Fusarium austroafricanum]
MNLESANTVEELQRQLQAANARNSHLEQLVQSQFRGDPTVLNQVAQNFTQAGFQIPSHGVSSARSSGLSRSKSTITYPTQVKSAITERQMSLQAHKRERRALSQQSSSALPMSRSVSNRSESHMPFTQTGSRIAPLTPSMDRFNSPQNESTNLPLEGASDRLPSVQENQPLLNIGMDPEDFLKQWPETTQGPEHYDTSFSGLTYNMAPDNSFSSLSSNIPSSYPMSSACPSMISGPSAAEAASPLTRQNSSFDSYAVGMERMESSQSQADALFAPDLSPSSMNMYPAVKQYTSEQDLIGFGANLTAANIQQYADSNENGFMTSPESTDMERSCSNTSMSSVRSNASNLERRAKEARERVLQSAKTLQLAPKPKEELAKSEVTQVPANKEAKLPVNKSNYQRPKHPKVYCTQCTEHPDGFRGDHELRRHVNAKHEGTVKKFVCRDPATVGIKSSVMAVNPLSKCKACISGKEYGAYYNAAAHLRRTHFKPKTPRGKKGAANSDEKRGGKGGGDWPPMSELKAWFVEKKVKVDLNDSPMPEQDDDEMVDGEVDGMPTQIDMFQGIGSNMTPFNVETGYDLAVDGAADPAMMASVNGELIPAPISSASGNFGYSPFNGSPIVGLADNYAFSEHATSAYGSNLSSTNTITPANFQEMSHMNMDSALWAA